MICSFELVAVPVETAAEPFRPASPGQPEPVLESAFAAASRREDTARPDVRDKQIAKASYSQLRLVYSQMKLEVPYERALAARSPHVKKLVAERRVVFPGRQIRRRAPRQDGAAVVRADEGAVAAAAGKAVPRPVARIAVPRRILVVKRSLALQHTCIGPHLARESCASVLGLVPLEKHLSRAAKALLDCAREAMPAWLDDAERIAGLIIGKL